MLTRNAVSVFAVTLRSKPDPQSDYVFIKKDTN